ncbi:MAG: HAD-IB family phosphatase [Acidimicrobiia bacterium]
MEPIDLARTAIFLDFDGTISAADTCVHLLDRLAPPEWHLIEAQYLAGEIGSRDGLRAEWAMLRKGETERRAVAREVSLDPGLDALVGALRASGAEVMVVSAGYGFYVDDQIGHLRREGVRIVSSAVDWETLELQFPNADDSCLCAQCGTCKRRPIADARALGLVTVLVGDGASDRRGAEVADVVFAKDGLAQWCLESDVAFTPFTCLDDVRLALIGSD